MRQFADEFSVPGVILLEANHSKSSGLAKSGVKKGPVTTSEVIGFQYLFRTHKLPNCSTEETHADTKESPEVAQVTNVLSIVTVIHRAL